MAFVALSPTSRYKRHADLNASCHIRLSGVLARQVTLRRFSAVARSIDPATNPGTGEFIGKNLMGNSEILLARQPILDAHQRLFAYELLYRSELEKAEFLCGNQATSELLLNYLTAV